MFKSIFSDSKVLMIEGQNNKAKILQEIYSFFKSNVLFEIALLGAKDGEKVRFVEMETESSILEDSSPYNKNYVEKELVTIDSLVVRYPDFKKLDFLKLDVQGYELEVLKGASRLLDKTEFVLMEASLIPVNKGCPLISDVIQFMAEKKFSAIRFLLTDSQERWSPLANRSFIHKQYIKIYTQLFTGYPKLGLNFNRGVALL